jgi:hypothetical protein
LRTVADVARWTLIVTGMRCGIVGLASSESTVVGFLAVGSGMFEAG